MLKGKVVMGLVGLPLPGVALVGALRLAKPSSFWAWWRYRGRKAERAEARYARVGARRERWRDLLSGSADRRAVTHE